MKRSLKRILRTVAICIIIFFAAALSTSCQETADVVGIETLNGMTVSEAYNKTLEAHENNQLQAIPYSVRLVFSEENSKNASYVSTITYNDGALEYVYIDSDGSTEQIAYIDGVLLYTDKGGDKYAYYTEYNDTELYLNNKTFFKKLHSVFALNIPASYLDDLCFYQESESVYYAELDIDSAKSSELAPYANFYKDGSKCKLYFTPDGVFNKFVVTGAEIDRTDGEAEITFYWESDRIIADCNTDKGFFYVGDFKYSDGETLGTDRGYSKGLEFTATSDNFCEVSGIGTCKDKNIVIPPVSPTGERVEAIGEDAFAACTTIQSVTFTECNRLESINPRAFKDCKNLKSIFFDDYNDSLESIYLSNNPIHIKESAFEGCENLSQISFSKNTQSIGFAAFAGCNSITSLTLPFIGSTASEFDKYSHFGYIFGAETYQDNASFIPQKLTTVSILSTPYEIEIRANAFYGCNTITNISIPKHVVSIGKGAFAKCNSLEKITLPFVGSDNSEVGSDNYEDKQTHFGYVFGASSYNENGANVPAKLKTVVITEKTTIAENAFSGCKNIESVSLTEGISSIGKSAFKECDKLSSIVLPFIGMQLDGTENTHFGYIFGAEDRDNNGNCVPKSLKSVTILNGTVIDEYAFFNCSSLEQIILTDTITSMGKAAFSGCKSLRQISLPKTITEISEVAFFDCSSLEQIILPDTITSIGKAAFSSCKSLKQISLPKTITEISEATFYDCNSLEKITFSSSLHTIGKAAFQYCFKLESITMSNRISEIGDFAFANCYSIRYLKFPYNVSYIGDSAFYNCDSLVWIELASSLDGISNNAFYDCDSLYVIKNNSNIVFEPGSTDYGYIARNAKLIVNSDGTTTTTNCVLTDDDFLFEIIDGKYKLIAYAGEGVTVTLPTDVEGNAYEIYRMRGVVGVTIPETMTSIGSEAFDGCTTLRYITIFDSITEIGKNAFNGCTSIETVNYTSSKANWGKIKIGDGNAALSNKIYYEEN